MSLPMRIQARTLPALPALMVAVILLSTALGLPTAAAQPCSSLKNPVFLAGSTALEPLYKAIGKSLATNPDPQQAMTLVYLKNGSCAGVSSLSQNQSVNFSYINETYDGISEPPTCTNDVVGGIAIDIALSDVGYSTCTNQALPATLGDFQGPIEAMVFITGKESTQVAITAEEAYYLFGFGQFGDVRPWNDESMLCVRSGTSGTQRLIAANIGVAGPRWFGKVNAGSAEVITCMTPFITKDFERTLGILGTEVFATASVRQNFKALAFRGFGQHRAYLPDSSPTAQDKRNVRNGRYLLFGPAHLITRIDGGGVPLSSRARFFIDLIVGKNPNIDVLTSIIRKARLVPQCAMHVSRSSDGGNLSLSSAAAPCDCFFETTATGAVPAACKSCGADSECPTAHCRFGFCEPR